MNGDEKRLGGMLFEGPQSYDQWRELTFGRDARDRARFRDSDRPADFAEIEKNDPESILLRDFRRAHGVMPAHRDPWFRERAPCSSPVPPQDAESAQVAPAPPTPLTVAEWLSRVVRDLLTIADELTGAWARAMAPFMGPAGGQTDAKVFRESFLERPPRRPRSGPPGRRRARRR